jgi:hypothetical protein
MKNRGSLDVPRHCAVGDAYAVHLYGQLDWDAFAAQIARHAEHRPTACAVANKDYFWRAFQLVVG